MIDIVKNNIKDSCFLNIFNCLDKYGKLSRSGIVRRSGLSLSTVAKALDIMLDCGVAEETGLPELDPETGRLSETFHIGIDGSIYIIDISEDRYSCFLFSKSGQAKEIDSRMFGGSGDPVDMLRRYLCKLRADGACPQHIGVIVRPDDAPVVNLTRKLLPPQPSACAIETVTAEIFPDSDCTIIPYTEAATTALEASPELESGRVHIYINATKLLYISIIGCPVGSISGYVPIKNGRMFCDLLRKDKSVENIKRMLAVFIGETSPIFNPDSVTLGTDVRLNEPDDCEDICDMISSQNSNVFPVYANMPTINILDYNLVVVGACHVIRKKIFSGMLARKIIYNNKEGFVL